LKTNAREINKRMGVVKKGKGGRIEKVDWEQGMAAFKGLSIKI